MFAFEKGWKYSVPERASFARKVFFSASTRAPHMLYCRFPCFVIGASLAVFLFESCLEERLTQLKGADAHSR